ncbi:hypothetical protein CI109_101343 [Kwoniella shandongensis]|uniref:Actin cytoskeleton-regulatory complex protein PAN1 n=1 Tax=Kwoniella shandongensis TaxID=1734106 RepID=A0AAJ8LGM2_9TREE
MQQPNQWQQQQYQYAQQTGNPNQGYGNPSYLSQQPTGFPQGMQPMQTGFQPQQQQQQQQQRPPMPSAPTGNYSFLSQPPPSSFRSQQGMQSQMTGFPGGGASGLMPQQTGYPGGGMMSQPTGMGMMSQPTGYAGGLTSQQTGMGRLQPQPTGMPHDPRLISLTQSFLPSNLSQPFAPSGVPQFANQNAPLTQQFQSLLQNPSVNTPKIPWALSRQEKKDYDQIFRAWDTKGDGFIPGEMAREVFGQSGLNDGDLMKIWNLSDVDNRGKLNLPEFHVAMGLIYRALNGNPIPETLPEELVPASMRDIDTTVNFMKDLLRHEASSRSNTSSPSYGGTPVSAAASKDALMYKHSDERPSTYKPSSRHLDRKSVRYSGEDPDAGLQDIRRKLQNTSTLLEKSAEKSTEDEELEEEIENLQYRVKRIQDDIEYTSKGRRTAEKDEERRKLERELLFLMHEKLPELERRQERRKEERAMEERAGVRRRDDRNRTAGRYDDRDEYDRDRYRGTFDRERSKDRYDDRDRYERRDSRDRYDSYDRDRRDEPRDRRGSYERPRSPPPAPPPASVAAATSAPPPPPAPATNASVPSTKNMTPEERKAYIREQAQRRINERLRALGVETAPTESAVDSSVQDRLELEKKEAEEKSKKAEEEQAARDEARRKRLAEAGGATEEEKPPASAAPAPPSPAQPVKSAMKKPAAPPPAPHSRAKGPPPAPSSRTAAPPPPPAPKAPAPPEEDPEEVELRQREEAAAKARAERKARLEALQREEEEERKHEEALLAARQNRSKGPSPAMSTPVAESAPPPPPPPPPAPPAPPADTSYNPFRKPSGAAAVASPPPAAPAAGGFNPFFKPQSAYSTPTGGQTPSIDAPSAAPPPPPAPPAPPAPPPAAAQTSRAPVRSPPSEPEWEDITEKQVDSDDDSSDDEYTSSRAGRQGLAQALFGNILPASMLPGGGSRPSSAAPSSPVAPKAPPAAVANLGGGNPEQSRGALLSAIQGGARLRKAQTVDKSGPGAAGKVVGDASPPEHIKNAPRPASPAAAAAEADESFNVNPHRQSVDWYQGLAADATHPAASLSENHVLEPTKEEDEPVPAGLTNGNALAPEINVENALRVRSLYEFQGTRDVDLSFKENVVILAHPAKDQSSDWWYGLSVKEGSKGWFPKSYVEEMTVTRAKAMYEYAAGEEDQLPFAEGDILEIVDKSDADWWKTEKAGVIFLVPAAYLEVIQGDTSSADVETNKERGLAADPGPLESVTEHRSVDREHYRVETADSVGLANANGGDIDLRVPRPAERPRPVSLLSVNSTGIPHSPILVTDDEGYSSSDDDSVLSWWSDDEDRSSHSEGVDDDEATGTDVGHHVKEKEREDGERKRREEERQKILSAVGLQLKREPPGVPTRPPGRIASRRRPAPGVPKKHKERRRAPAVPSPDKTKKLPLFPSASISNLDLTTSPTVGEEEEEEEEANKSPKLETQDAYARYEAYLAQSQSKSQAQPLPTPSSAVRDGQSSYSRPVSQIMTTPQLSDPVQTPQSPTPSTTLSLSTSLGKESSSGGGAGGRLSGFMSRLIGPLPHHHTGNGSNSGKPTISGPIVTRLRADSDLTRPPTPGTPILLGTPLGPGAGGADESFGKTWSSLVEPGIVETMGQRERKRQEAIFEFIATEGGYNRDLQLIVEVFYASLLSILDDKALTVIFANIEDILLFNTSFLSSLEGRQRSCRLYIDRIGDVLEEHLANAGVYMTYCVNQHQAIKLLQSLRESNPELSSHLQNIRETNPAVRGLDLSSFLLIPMQRITRYPLLIKQIISYTDLDCDAASDLPLVSSALRTVEGIVGQINESVREAEGEERLRVLSEDLWIGGEGRLDLTAPTMFMGPRRLLKEGKVSKAKSGRKLTMVLCNDIVVLLDERDLYRMPLPLHEVQVKQGRDELGFVLKVDQRRGGDLIALRAPTARDAKDWMMLLGKARARAVEARRGAA